MKSSSRKKQVTGPPRPEFPRGLVAFLAVAAFFLSCLSFLASNDEEAAAGIPTQVVMVTDQGDQTTTVLSKDPIKDQWDVIVSRDYEAFEDIASGRFYRDGGDDKAFDVLEALDPDEFRPQRRGQGWVMVEAPFSTRRLGKGTAVLRFVNEDDSWKLEHLRVVDKER